MATSLLTVMLSLLAAIDAGSSEPSVVPVSSPPAEEDAPAPRLSAEAFAVSQKPRPRRTQVWTKARRNFAPAWERDYPGVHFSRFLSLARPTLHPPKEHTPTPREARITLFRFASAVVADLTQTIDLACPRGRCALAMEEASACLARFVGGGPRDFTFADRSRAVDQTRHWYGWRLHSGTTSFELGCTDVDELPEVTCRLELELADGLVLSYQPKTRLAARGPDITIRRQGDAQGKPVGEIEFDRTYSGAPVVILSGAALGPNASR